MNHENEVIATTTSLAILYCLIVWTMVSPLGCASAGKSDVRTTIQEAFTAGAVSILSQAEWQKVLADLKGRIGPDSVIRIEGYTKQVAGAEILVHGSSLSLRIVGEGAGGNPHEMELVDKLRGIAQRYGLEQDLTTQARIQRDQAVLAIVAEYIALQAAQKLPTTLPSTRPAK